MDTPGQAGIARDQQNKFALSTGRRQTLGQGAACDVVRLTENDRGAGRQSLDDRNGIGQTCRIGHENEARISIATNAASTFEPGRELC